MVAAAFNGFYVSTINPGPTSWQRSEDRFVTVNGEWRKFRLDGWVLLSDAEISINVNVTA